MTGPYGEHALELHRRGWHPIPVDRVDYGVDPDGRRVKKPSVRGVTGWDGVDDTETQIRARLAKFGANNIGLRMDRTMIGIDIDQRDGKTGWDNLLAFQNKHDLPDLPDTVFVTSKVWPSGILLFAVPDELTYDDGAIGDVDILQRHHRFVMGPGSIHPKTGDVYTAADRATCEVLEVLPYADEIIALPGEWVQALRKRIVRAERHEPVQWENPHRFDEPWSEDVVRALRSHWDDRKAAGRHPAMISALCALWRLDQRQEAGAGHARARLRHDFIRTVTADQTRTVAEAEAEFDEADDSALKRIAETPRTHLSTAEVAEALDLKNWASPDVAKPSAFLSRDGLQATTLGRHLLDQGPIRPGVDGRLWSWDGYWRPTGAEETRRRVRAALGQRFRPAHTNTMLEWLRAEPELDPNRPDFATINCASGLLDWRTGHLQPHTPEHTSTTRLPVRWNPDAECPAVDDLLHQVLDDDAVPMFYELVGYLCAAGNPLHVAVLLLGSGRNGKGTLLRLLEALLGPGNCSNVTPHQMADNRFAAAGLYGKLANIAGDLEAALIERTDLFKMATGGDTISAEIKYGAAFSFRCWSTFVFSGNEAPAVRDHSEGYYSRWQVLPFDRVIPEADRLPEHVLAARLHTPAELEGMFARGVEGLRRLMDRGRFDQPASVREATAKFRIDTDPIAQFLAEEIHVDPDGWIPRRTLYGVYQEWSNDNGRGRVAASKLYARLPNVASLRTRQGVRGFVGIALGGCPDTEQGAKGAVEDPFLHPLVRTGERDREPLLLHPLHPAGPSSWDEDF